MPTLECQQTPDIAVQGSRFAASWAVNLHDFGFCTNVNGPAVSIVGSSLNMNGG